MTSRILTNPPVRFTWRAGPDGTAHAQWATSRHVERTACQSPPVLERLAWPAVRKCEPCLELLGLDWTAA